MKRKEIHVVPNTDKVGQDANKPELSKISKHFDKKQDAIKWSRNQAIKEERDLLPHGMDGKIQNPNSNSEDPCPSKDKN